MDVTFFENLPFYPFKKETNDLVQKEEVALFVTPISFPSTTPIFSQVHNVAQRESPEALVQESLPSVQVCSPPSDLDLLIAKRKKSRSCTLHPISNFVSYATAL